MFGLSKNGKNSKKNRNKNNSGTNPPSTTKTVTNPIDYEKLRDIIVEANQIIKEKEALEEKEKMKSDYLTSPLVHLLDAFFWFAIISLGFINLAGMYYSYTHFDYTSGILSRPMMIGFWTVFLLTEIFYPIINFKKKQTRGFVKVGKIVLAIFLVFLLVMTIYAFAANQQLPFMVVIVIFSYALMLICYWAQKTLKTEFDRAFIISYFSVIVSIAALAVSAVALYK